LVSKKNSNDYNQSHIYVRKVNIKSKEFLAPHPESLSPGRGTLTPLLLGEKGLGDEGKYDNFKNNSY